MKTESEIKKIKAGLEKELTICSKHDLRYRALMVLNRRSWNWNLIKSERDYRRYREKSFICQTQCLVLRGMIKTIECILSTTPADNNQLELD